MFIEGCFFFLYKNQCSHFACAGKFLWVRLWIRQIGFKKNSTRPKKKSLLQTSEWLSWL